MNQGSGISIGGLIYLIIGLVIALDRGYSYHTISQILSLVVAVLLWPIVLIFGFHPLITLGG